MRNGAFVFGLAILGTGILGITGAGFAQCTVTARPVVVESYATAPVSNYVMSPVVPAQYVAPATSCCQPVASQCGLQPIASAPTTAYYGQCAAYNRVQYMPTTAYSPVTAAPAYAPAPVNYGGYYIGSGLLGQPTLYADGQPLRNFLRYLSP